MPQREAGRQQPDNTSETQLVEAIRTNMIEMTNALRALDVDSIEVELPYRAAWSNAEEAK